MKQIKLVTMFLKRQSNSIEIYVLVQKMSFSLRLRMATPTMNSELLWEVLKLCIILSHGKASVEGGFLINKSLLVENLHGESLIAQRTVYDTIKYYGVIVNVPVDGKMLLSARADRRKYRDYLETNLSRKVMQENKIRKKENC
ncbi:hypothetical protein PR048_022114 [Dryococelus australis]|uniref:Uncharacterized protein n=1 Tax=Dryococelus australis TaxID=614101 RepID=A0ABQ9H058_9NEOP|nr:hypothetical protein PR048_022114 [Dryococelus australis]